MRGAATKGPIFEDGPNFDMAFKLFHGRDGVVPLSRRSNVPSENFEIDQPAPQFNPLAAKAATISLSGFGAGWPFNFDAFSQKWKNQKKKSHSSKVNPQISLIIQNLFVFIILMPQFLLIDRGIDFLENRFWWAENR